MGFKRSEYVAHCVEREHDTRVVHLSGVVVDAELVGVQRQITAQLCENSGRTLEGHASVTHEQTDPSMVGGEGRTAEAGGEFHVVGDHRHARDRAPLLNPDRRQKFSRHSECLSDRSLPADRHLVAVVARGIPQRHATVDIDIAVGESTLKGHLNVETEILMVEQFADLVLRSCNIHTERVGDRQRCARPREKLAGHQLHAAGGRFVAGLDHLKPQIIGKAKEPPAGRERPANALVSHDHKLVARLREIPRGKANRDRAVEDRFTGHNDLIVEPASGSRCRAPEHKSAERAGSEINPLQFLPARLIRIAGIVWLRLRRSLGDNSPRRYMHAA